MIKRTLAGILLIIVLLLITGCGNTVKKLMRKIKVRK